MQKNIFVLLFLIGSFSATALKAQNTDLTAEAKKMTDKQTETLHLTSDQYAKADSINLNFITKAREIKSGGGSKLSQLKSLKKIDEDRTESMKAILTEDQFQQFKAMKEQNRKTLRAGFKNKQG